MIAFAVRIEPVHPAGAAAEKNIERYDAFLAQIARHLARFKSASDALEGVVALTAAALEIPFTVAFVLGDDDSHDAYAHNMPQAIVESALRSLEACAGDLGDPARPVRVE